MEKEFLVVLFKNKTKKKILKKYKTLNRAKEFYEKLISNSQNIFFEKRWENALNCDYEISLMTNEKSDINVYFSDELGRNVKVELDDENYQIIKIQKFKVEELIFDCNLKKKINFDFFIKKYLDKGSIKIIFSLNNKIVVQNDDSFKFFSLKNSIESQRFIDSLSNYFLSEKRYDVILVKDFDSSQRGYLYQLLSEKGYDKKFLYRNKTTYSHRSSRK